MRVVQINATCGKGSTGKICSGISTLLHQNGIDDLIIYSIPESGRERAAACSDAMSVKADALKARLFGNWGFNSGRATRKIERTLDTFKPDIVHLHNLHGHFCDISRLLKHLAARHIATVWTFHDCWAYTGYCMYYDSAKCEKWKNGCKNCPQKKTYSWFFDKSAKLQQRKKELIGDLDLTVVTPSQWLADEAAKSFLRDKPIKVINNGIDLSVFSPSGKDGEIRERLGIGADDHLILGVAYDWDGRKGLDVFCRMAETLPGNYKIVLVGTDDAVDKLIPGNIISIHRTQNQAELAELYSAADLLLNPTREENFPTVNIESLACGTPVVTYRTGGSPEIIDESCGSVVERDDIGALEREVVRVCTEKPYSTDDCVSRASLFDMNDKFAEYIELYKEVRNDRVTKM